MLPSESSFHAGLRAGAPVAALAAAPVGAPAPATSEPAKPAGREADWVTRYVARLHRLRFLLPLLWLLLFVVGCIAMGPVFANLKLQVRARRGRR